MAYVDYAFYADSYGGTAVDAVSFANFEVRSRMQIDKYTFRRVQKAIATCPDFVVPEEIKLAQCAIMDYLIKYDNGATLIVASETVGKHSVSYAGVSVKTYDQEIQSIVSTYLGGTSWTYRGGGAGEIPQNHNSV